MAKGGPARSFLFMPAAFRAPQILDIGLRGGRRVRARRWSGRGSVCVYLHGLLDSSEGWTEIAQASTRPSVALDLPGFGGSDLPLRPRISAYAQDVAAALRALELRDVTLVGHSLGGAVATAVAETSPEMVKSLVLLAPAGFGRIALAEAVSIPGVRNVAAALLPTALNAPLVLRTSYRYFVTAGHAAPDDVVARVRREAASLPPAAVVATRAIVAAGRSKHGFHRRQVAYRGPVAVLWGEVDRVVSPNHVRAVARALPQAKLSIWDGMGHHPQRERPAELARYLQAASSSARRAPVERRSVAVAAPAGATSALSRRPAAIAAAPAQ